MSLSSLLWRQTTFGAKRRTWITPASMQWYRENGIGWWPAEEETEP